jgi:hypothetical protein
LRPLKNYILGSAKRDIVRKKNVGGGGATRKISASGQVIDDGSTYEDGAALNDEDPNFDSEVTLYRLYLNRFLVIQL